MKQLQIINANTAKEINPLGYMPDLYNYNVHQNYMDQYEQDVLDWQEAERKLKEYRIVGYYLVPEEHNSFVVWEDGNPDFKAIQFPIGSIHYCNCNEKELNAVINGYQ